MKLKLISVSMLVSIAGCGEAPVSEPLELPPEGTVNVGRGLPPLYGGTIRALAHSEHVVVADPDRDRIQVVHSRTHVVREVPLRGGDRPFRVVEHGDTGRVSVVLRGAGEIITFGADDVGAGGSAGQRRAACADPRGAAFDETSQRLLVACASGELIRLPDLGGEPEVVARLPRDLRDVVISGDVVSVSSFRATQLFQLSRVDFRPLTTLDPPGVRNQRVLQSPSVAWRVVGGPSGSAVMSHQLAQVMPVDPNPDAGGYGTIEGGLGNPCVPGGIVTGAVTILSPGGSRTARVANAGIPLDIAVSPDGRQVAMAYASVAGVPQVLTIPLDVVLASDAGCGGVVLSPAHQLATSGVVTSVDFTPDGRLVALQTDPLELHIDGAAVALGGGSVRDTGRDTFHLVTNAGIACASCHPEGGDDGHTWDFVSMGARRTQSLMGGLGQSAPFHWSGDMPDFSVLIRDVMTGRMRGPELTTAEMLSLAGWIETIPAPGKAPVADTARVRRGQALFESAEVACASCHSGARRADSMDVGTGGRFQVPSLVGVSYRGPFMHNGCAPTLRDRFGACGGGDRHGKTSHLSATQVDDLVAYLETL